MKKNIFAILILLASQVWAQSMNGFANIDFGLDREDVIEDIMKLGYDPLGQVESGDRVVIPVYMLGDLPVQVDFLFNKNNKFEAMITFGGLYSPAATGAYGYSIGVGGLYNIMERLSIVLEAKYARKIFTNFYQEDLSKSYNVSQNGSLFSGLAPEYGTFPFRCVAYL